MFSINDKNLWAFEVLEEEGFLYDSSVYPTLNFWYGYPTAPRGPYLPVPGLRIVEVPLSTVKLLGIKFPVAGGFYFRLLPYPLVKKAVEKINQEGLAANIYLHPWDLDPDQPYPNPTLRERFTHYYNLEHTEEKLKRLLADFQFSPIKELLEKSDYLR
jgi:polysaccharide deacetylase family protein (PEP-CTERM system associated)